MQEPIKMMTRKEVAAMLRVTPMTLYTWVRKGKFPAPAKILGYPRWKESDVRGYIEKQFAKARA